MENSFTKDGMRGLSSTYPTTIYLSRDGRVARIHAGFASSATREAHVALQREVDELVQRLLPGESAN